MSRDGARAAARQAAGRPGETVYHFDKADVILSLDADFLACGPGSVRYTRDFADRRRVSEEQKTMNRLYAVESTPSLTGAKADHRLPMRASDVEGFARQIAAAVGVAGAAGAARRADAAWIAAVAKDLQAHRGTSLVVAGEYQPAAVHARRARDEPGARQRRRDGHLWTGDRSRAAGSGGLDGRPGDGDGRPARSICWSSSAGIPVFSAPADLKFAERLAKVPLAVYHGLYVDETADLCHWNIADTHPLESWGDARAYDGTVTLIQPLIAPLYEGRSAHEVVSTLAGQSGRAQLDIVKDYWTRAFDGQGGWTLPRRGGQAVHQRRSVLEACAARRFHPRHVDRRRGTGDAIRAGAQAAAPATLRDRGRDRPQPEHRRPQPQPRTGSSLHRHAAPSAPDSEPCRAHRQLRRRGSRSSSGPIPRCGTAASPTTGGCRSCPSR